MGIIGIKESGKTKKRLDLQPGSILAVFNFVEIDLGDGEVRVTKEGRD